MKANTTVATRTRRRSAALPMAVVLLAMAGCTEMTGPDGLVMPPEGQVPTEAPVAGGVYFSFAALAEGGEGDGLSSPDEALNGWRWCDWVRSWLDTGAKRCNLMKAKAPFGEASLVDGELRLAVGPSAAAPFLWTAGPQRVDPFPPEDNFVLDVRVTYEQLATKGTGVWVSRWVPAETDGRSDPFASPVMFVWADVNGGLRVNLLGQRVGLEEPLGTHEYRLVYEDGEYSVYADGQRVAGPVASDVRPNSVWLGNPEFTTWGGDWSDFRVGDLTVSLLEDPEVPVAFDVKPGNCPTQVSRKARGVLPVAILGSGDFDVSKVIPSSIKLEGMEPLRHAYEHVGTPDGALDERSMEECHSADVDEHMDMTLKFDNQSIVRLFGEDVEDGAYRKVRLTGLMKDGESDKPIVGEDWVVVRK